MAEYLYHVQSWETPAGASFPSYVYIETLADGSVNKVSAEFYIKMHNEGLIKPSGGDDYLAQKFNLDPAPPPYEPPPEDPAPPPPTAESYMLTITLNSVGSIANRLQELTTKLMNLEVYGWSIAAVDPIGANAVQIEILKTGSISLSAVVLIIVGIIAVMFITGSISYTIIRKSDNAIVDQQIRILDAINEAERTGEITPEQAEDARAAILNIQPSDAQSDWFGGDMMKDVQAIIPLVIIIMLISSVRK